MISELRMAAKRLPARINRSKFLGAVAGVFFFALFYFLPPLSPALDPSAPGPGLELSRSGQLTIGLFLLAATWWVFEVLPIGVTSIAIAALQVLFGISRQERPLTAAFTDFMDPAIWFILGALVMGLAFTKTGLTRRLAYKMLSLMGERTSMIYLGSFLMSVLLTLVMSHTAVASTVFPLLMAIYSLFEESDKPTRFGKGLFIGIAYICGVGSVMTFLGSARAVVAVGFFQAMTGGRVGFFDLTYYMLPVGVAMTAAVWGLVMTLYPPERPSIPGLSARARQLYDKLGPVTANEILCVLITLAMLLLFAFTRLDQSAVIMTAALLFFLLRILDLDDLEKLPWNIVLLFGGAMSLGSCLGETGAASWLALKGFQAFADWPGWAFVLAVAIFVLIMTNFIMNIAALAFALPVGFALAQRLGVTPEVILFASLVTAGMPFMLLIGAAANAIAYESRQFTPAEFFRTGVLASLILMVLLGLLVTVIWPAMGLPVAGGK
jgi:sodium-dependent dicarboxylate transporter 2/3/5